MRISQCVISCICGNGNGMWNALHAPLVSEENVFCILGSTRVNVAACAMFLSCKTLLFFFFL